MSPLPVTTRVSIKQDPGGVGMILERTPVALSEPWGRFPGSYVTHFLSWEVLLSLEPKGLSSKSRAALRQTN